MSHAKLSLHESVIHYQVIFEGHSSCGSERSIVTELLSYTQDVTESYLIMLNWPDNDSLECDSPTNKMTYMISHISL